MGFHIDIIYMEMGDYYKLLLPSVDPVWKQHIKKEWMFIYEALKIVRTMIPELKESKKEDERESIKEGKAERAEDDKDSDEEIELLASHINNIYMQMGEYLKLLEPSEDPDWKERIKEWMSEHLRGSDGCEEDVDAHRQQGGRGERVH